MYTFVKIKDKKTNLNYSWLLKCEDFNTLLDHEQKYIDSQIPQGFSDFLQVKKGQNHPKNDISAILCAYESLGFNPLHSFSLLKATAFLGKMKALNEKNVIYLNNRGGYFTPHEDLEEKDLWVSKKLIYPSFSEKDIRVFQWPNGKHWYAKLGNMDVMINNIQKWDSEIEAKNAAIAFLNEIL